ncbi:flagellar motor switch protein FliG [Buchnera aphidicola]|uniref:flagellar motor switch protein FliG n=1 Tax=Buchnera aphidicola TaxID=9 RepID=UPI003BEED213
MILNGIEKSALLLMSIGSEQSGEILKHLTFFEVQTLITAMVNLNQFSTKTLIKVLRECYENTENINNISCNSDKYLSSMLTKALGENKGHILLQEVLEIHNTKMYIEAFNFMPPNHIFALLSKEHPQIITTILVHLEKKQVVRILSFFSNEMRSEIILRIAEFTGIEESNLIKLKEVISTLLKNKKLILSDKGGIKIAASILNSMNIVSEKKIMKKMYEYNNHLASQILKEMHSFDNILNLKDDYIQLLVKSIDHEKLYVALQNTNLKIREKFFKNMPENQAFELNLSLQKHSYISDQAIKNEQKLILMMIKAIIKKNN